MIVIGGGNILSDGTLDALRAQVTRERWLLIDLVDETETVSDPQAEVIRRDGDRVVLRFDPGVVDIATLIGRVSAAHAVRDLFVQNPPIEEIIARLYAGHEAAK